MRKTLFVVAALFAVQLCALAQVSFGQASKFNEGWLFKLGDTPEAVDASFNDTRWRKLNVPHDWSVEGTLSPSLASCTGFLPGGIAWYRKHFDGAELRAGAKQIYIYFEAIYNRSSVYLNGHLLGHRPNGYASFLYDLTPYIVDGDNVLSVRVDHSQYADSRWYTGSGIYRDVWIVRAADVHFAQWGVSYSAKSIDAKQAVVAVDASIEGLQGKKLNLRLSIFDADGKQVSTKTVKAQDEQSVELKVSSPKLWNLDSPYLYNIKAEILDGKSVVDATDIAMGLRTLQFDADKGFALNGKWMKVKGVCLHHDAGVLGAAVPEEVWERRLRNLKSIGTNAIRTSHNPQAPVFYDICDRIGLLVMDEAFDEWEFPKRKWVEGWNVGTPAFQGTFDFFEEWGERDLADMIRRDRNHPSIFLWSIGNEVDYPNDPYSHPILDGGNEDFTQPTSGGYKPDAPHASRIGVIAQKFAKVVRSVDTSRPVTGALAGVAMSNQTAYPEAVDVVGYNYTESRYQSDHQKYPKRIIYGSENRHDYAAWLAVKDNPHIFGQFLWTGTDYLGESNAWPSRGFYSGLLDFGSFVKPRGHFRAALWSESPVCYIGTSTRRADSTDAWPIWNYDDGQSIHVVCYTNASSASLHLNGREVGEKKSQNPRNGIISWDVPYAAGTLKAVAYDADGKVIAEHELRSSLQPYSLKVTADKQVLEGKDSVAHLTVEIFDINGVPVVLADNDITCRVEGQGELLGLEGSNNTDMTNYRDASHRAYMGRLLAYVRSTADKGQIRVVFTSALLKGAECSITIE